MAVIEAIKQQILTLDSGEFQVMCDQLLFREGYGTIMSLGTQAGTKKTTKGTPDAYFLDTKGQYIFVEYTTQQENIALKIETDIKKCFDVEKTKVPLEKISKIIYCHTSSNLAPGDDLALRKLCSAHQIGIVLWGIDYLAERIFQCHHDLAKEYLHIPIGTGQIKELPQFLHDYDANELSAPLATKFLYREEEINTIHAAYQTCNVVVLTGRAGVGKSRLALHYAEKYATTEETVFCIRSNAQVFYEDFKLHMNIPGSYLLVVDDANELSELRHVLEYATNKEAQYHVRILLTVRDYAIEKIKRDVQAISKFQQVEITAFSDEQIEQLVKKHYGITNPDYLDRIARIAEGNARIAMLAGKIAKEANQLDSINDLTDLFEAYYGSALEKRGISVEWHLFCAAGIVAFLSPFDCTAIDHLLPVFEKCNMSRADFMEALNTLHEKEVVEIHYNQIVRFDEPCLSNYVLKLVFIDKCYVPLKTMLSCCFHTHRSRTTQALRTLTGVFRSENVYNAVQRTVLALWKELESGDPVVFHAFVKELYQFNFTEAARYVKRQIDSQDEYLGLPTKEEVEAARNHQIVKDDILIILGGFADTRHLETALDLFFTYFQKHSGDFLQFFHAIQQSYGILRDSCDFHFYTQKLLIRKFREYSLNWANESVTILFLESARELLHFQHSFAEAGRKHSVTFCRMELPYSDALLEFRALLWTALIEVDKNKYLSYIEAILRDYANGYTEISKSVIVAESPYVIQLAVSVLNAANLEDCLIAEHLVNILVDNGYHDETLTDFIESPLLIAHTEIFLPPNAPLKYADRQTLWNAVEKCEQGKKAQLAYSFDITLQVELSMEENLALARRFVQEQLVSKGMIADLAVHLPEKEEGGIPNPHFHVMVPMRPLNPDGTWGQKQRREYKLDENGNRIRNEKGQYIFNAVHTTDWNTPETLEGWRSVWCSMVNAAFEQKGLDCRIDHRSYERQGIEKIPTVHEGPKVRQMEKRGIATDKGTLNRWITATNDFLSTAKEKLNALRQWIDELKEIFAPPAERNLVSILSAYYRKRDEGAVYRSGKTANLKSMNKVMNYLIDNKITTVSDLETFFDGVYGKYHDLGDSIRQQEGRRRELTELLRCSENMKKYQPVYDECQSICWKGRKEKYKAEHDQELTIYYTARRTLKENPGNPAAWCKELEQIETETAELNQQRGELYSDVQMLFQIQNAVNQVLHEEQKAERQPSLHPTYRHNRKDENLE